MQQSDSEGDSAEKTASIVLTFLHVKSGIVDLWNCGIFCYIIPTSQKYSRKPPTEKKWKGRNSEGFAAQVNVTENSTIPQFHTLKESKVGQIKSICLGFGGFCLGFWGLFV
jgi:hypothetical protein